MSEDITKTVGRVVINVPENQIPSCSDYAVSVENIDSNNIYLFQSDGSQCLITHIDDTWFGMPIYSSYGSCTEKRKYSKKMGIDDQFTKYVRTLLKVGTEIIELRTTAELACYILDHPETP